MKFSKMFLMLMLTMVLILGTMGSSFAKPGDDHPPKVYYELNFDITVPEGGSVTADPKHSPRQDDFNYESGTEVTLTITPNPGFKLISVKIKDGDTLYPLPQTLTFIPSREFDINMTSDKTVEVVFSKLYWLNLESNPEHLGNLSGVGFYAEGETVNVTAGLNDGIYMFRNWADSEGTVLSTNPVYEFTMPASNTSLTANYGEVINVNLLRDPNNKGLVNTSGLKFKGEEFTIHASNVDGENFGFAYWGWNDSCLEYQGENDGALPDVIEDPSEAFYTTNPNPAFIYEDCLLPPIEAASFVDLRCPPQPKPDPINVELTAYYFPIYKVTTNFIDTSSTQIADPVVEWYFSGQNYTTSPLTPAPTGYEPPETPSLASGEIAEKDIDVNYIYVKTVPPTVVTVTDTVTNTVYETVYVNVPAPTEPTTEVLPTEPVPLGAATVVNFDSIYDNMEMPTTEEILLPEEETPLADALPQTGQLPGELFYGIGGLVSAVGVFMKRKFNK